jgi:hypothetical protein
MGASQDWLNWPQAVREERQAQVRDAQAETLRRSATSFERLERVYGHRGALRVRRQLEERRARSRAKPMLSADSATSAAPSDEVVGLYEGRGKPRLTRPGCGYVVSMY